MYIKVKFIKNGELHSREYTYKATFPVRVGQEIILPGGGNGIVTEINVTEESVESFKDKIKEIESVVEEDEVDNNGTDSNS